MTAPHDFEFQFGRNRALRGRGWRGLLALGLLVSALAMMSGDIGVSIVNPIKGGLLHLIFEPKISNGFNDQATVHKSCRPCENSA